MENDNNTPELELDENQNQEGQEDNHSDDTQDQNQSKEEEKDWKAEALKWKAIADRNKDKKPETKARKSNELTQSDVIAIIKNNVDEEDIPEIADFAKLKGITFSEALKSSIVKNILREKQEERSVAEATHTGASRKGATKVSDETLLANARAGKMPDNEADMKRLIEARKRFK